MVPCLQHMDHLLVRNILKGLIFFKPCTNILVTLPTDQVGSISEGADVDDNVKNRFQIVARVVICIRFFKYFNGHEYWSALIT